MPKHIKDHSGVLNAQGKNITDGVSETNSTRIKPAILSRRAKLNKIYQVACTEMHTIDKNLLSRRGFPKNKPNLQTPNSKCGGKVTTEENEAVKV